MQAWGVRWAAVILAVVLHGEAQGQSEAPAPAFEKAACDLPGMTEAVRPRLQCGTVAVPRDYAHPEAGVFRLAVVIVHPRASQPGTGPVLFIHGGPGSPLTVQAVRIAQGESATLARNRDLILVDQRGAGRSEPALCPGLAREQVGVFARGGSEAEIMARWRATYDGCRRELVRDGIDPAWFGTVVTARDLEGVRRALGIARWSIYARSYGTEVAMSMAAREPASVRAVVLDSVYPPDPLPLTRAQTVEAALQALFAACAAAPACTAAHPDLAATYREAVAGLGREPLAVPRPAGAEPARIALSPTVFRGVVELALYFRPLIALLPGVIQAAHDRDAAGLSPLIEHVAAQFVLGSAADQAIVECRDRPSFQAPAGASMTDLHGVCEGWIAPGPAGRIPEATEVPTLLLAGAIDPVTPPAFAELVAARMGGQARVIVFPGVGHDVEESTPCGAAIVSRFIQRPRAPVDAACVASVPAVVFH